MSLEQTTVFVTGGARGIGLAIAEGVASRGANVVIGDIDVADAEAAAQSLCKAGARALGLPLDVRDRASVRDAFAATLDKFGSLDVLVNNAGICRPMPFLEITEEAWQAHQDVNALGVLICMQEAIREMVKAKRGKIINLASIAGKAGFEPFAHYCATKFSVVALTQTAAKAFGPDGITANAICPGIVRTAMWDGIDRSFIAAGLSKAPDEAFNAMAQQAVLGRSSVPDDIVGTACFLASRDSDFMTGQALVVDGGIVFS